ncbi:trehalose-phosphatase [Mycolicibacterium fallax]|uniref:Trehalose 6-phosphate phosphatase n=2 Tax=Mycolicibacterium fallax TaxID=1793 RepID=A0A1X1RAA5_MYCFA|nr:trehalose-phosphatase [Mycolicibacterium fallax]ORV02058.1 HAD family hydrolase [Mycolicibacterium fallax]BBY99786.1 trehalose 6-phosphate phosphatase [Mycolicibacterium fallax]
MPGPPAALREALSAAARSPRLLVAADFDGTLAPIVAHPPDARPAPGALAALTALAELPGVTVALVSGRALADLRLLSGARAPIRLVGSHGAEFEDGFDAAIDTALREQILAALTDIAEAAPGVTVEAKPAGAALHIRNAAPSVGAAALDRARAAARNWPAKLTAGKAVLEFSVLHTDKGAAVQRLRDELRCETVVFLGDDVTDETVFDRLGGADVGVKVGQGPTAAAHRVEDPAAVVAVLAFLRAARDG